MPGSRIAVAAALGLTLALSSPAHAGDVCVPHAGAGCDLSGDLVFFRFLGAKLPRSVEKVVHLHGRARGDAVQVGRANFFGYDLDSACSVTIVDRADEPGLPAS